jgi:NADH dehydrogenase
MLPRVVIVGGGFGGLKAARELDGAPVQITLIDKSNHHLFQPLLYQVATAGLSPADIAAPIRGILRHQKNADVLLGEVTGVDPGKREVLVHNQHIPYDYLILATGSNHSYFGHSEWEEYAPGLKSITDATHIRQRILLAFEAAESESDPKKKTALLTFVIVGAGPTGVELAGALYELSHFALASDFRHIDPASTRIVLIEAGPRILATFSEETALKAQERLKSFGVEVRTNSRVEQVDSEGVAFGGVRIHAHTVLWAAGVEASPAASWLSLDSDRVGRAKVLPDLTVPGHPEIFIIGDTATLVQDGKPLPGVAPVALQQGAYVAKVIRGEIRKDKKKRGHFHYHDKGNLATVGRAFAIVELGRFKETGFFAWILWLLVHIYYLIGFRNRLVVVLEWAWAYLTFQRGARLITPSTQCPGGEISGAGSLGGRISGGS